MKSMKTVVALLVAVAFVFAVAAYAQDTKAEKAAERATEKVDKADAAKAAAEPAAKAVSEKEVAKDKAASEAALKAEKAEEKASEKTEKADKAEAAKEAAATPPAAKISEKELDKEKAATKAEMKAEKASEALDKMDQKEARGAEKKDVLGVAAELKEFKTFDELVKLAGLDQTLKGKGPFTVFAPVDGAFAKMLPADLDALKKDKEKLAGVLKLHVVEGKVTVTDLKKVKEVTTLGGKVAVGVAKEKDVEVVTIGGAKIANIADVEASNGLLTTVEAVIKK